MKDEMILNKAEEKTVEEYLAQFNEDFQCKLNLGRQQFPIICRMFEEYFQDYTTGKLYKKVLSEMVKVEEKLLPTLTSEQKILFNEWNGLSDRLCYDEILQMFILGYCTATELNNETCKPHQM